MWMPKKSQSFLPSFTPLQKRIMVVKRQNPNLPRDHSHPTHKDFNDTAHAKRLATKLGEAAPQEWVYP